MVIENETTQADPVARTDWIAAAAAVTFPAGLLIGGVELSGFGRDKSRHALDEYRDLKTTWIKYE